jgi:tripartite-type tricarboxylate transporter receptor subunit TctC
VTKDNMSKVSRRQTIAGLAALTGGGLLGAPGIVRAQSAWKPSGNVTIVVPWPPGGALDILSRLVVPAMSKILGQTVLVVNKAGATGSIGTTQVYDAKPDGTMLLAATTDNTLYAQVSAAAQYDPLKFVPVALLASSPYALLGKPELAASNLKELLPIARANNLNYGNAGLGGSMHVLTTAFGQAANIDHMQHVAYQGMAPALNALMGNFTDVTLTVTGGTLGYRGKIKFLGVTSAERVPALPEVPTLVEQGLQFVFEAWMGILAPPNTPAPIVAALSNAFTQAISDPGYQAKVVEFGMRMIKMNQPDFAKYYVSETEKWGDVVKKAGIKI